MVQIRNEGPRLKLAGKVVLERGFNEVESERWKACVGHQMTQVFLGTGMIRVVSGVGSPARSDGEPEPDLPATLKAEPETVQSPDTNVDPAEEETKEIHPESMMSAKDAIARVKTCRRRGLSRKAARARAQGHR